MCDRAGCNEPPEWHPVMVLYAPMGDVPIRSILSLKVCSACRSQCELSDFLSDDGWAQIVMAITSRGKACPDRSRTKLDWTPIHGHESEMLANVQGNAKMSGRAPTVFQTPARRCPRCKSVMAHSRMVGYVCPRGCR